MQSKQKVKFHLILMAAGFSRRFGENKLLQEWNGKPLYLHTMERLAGIAETRSDTASLIVVTRYEEIMAAAKERGIPAFFNEKSEEGIASTIRIGTREAMKIGPAGECAAYVYFVADQPLLSRETVEALLDRYREKPEGILCASAPKMPGNPVIFSGVYQEELLSIHGDVGGKQVMQAHPDAVRRREVPAEELVDIDCRDDLQELKKNRNKEGPTVR